MPKQGHFAKSTRVKQLNNFKDKRHASGATIADDQLTDFLVVRFALTAKKRVPKVAQESTQRFLIEIGGALIGENGDLSKIVPARLKKVNAQVPWQFFKQIVDNWALLQKFLVKEVPAVPLTKQLLVKNQLTTAELGRAVAQLLAQKVAAISLVNQHQSAGAKQKQLAQMLMTTICPAGHLDWAKVKALLGPLPYTPDPALDQPTREWLNQLSQQE